MPLTNEERLHRLKRFKDITLAQVDYPERFDMNYYVRTEDVCGAVCCALGHAGLDPVFRGLGLVTDVENHSVTCGDHHGCSAGAKFFDLLYDRMNFITSPCHYAGRGEITPQLVAEHIEEIIRECSLSPELPEVVPSSAV